MTEDPMIPLNREGLGNSNSLIEFGDERALVLDPSSDIRVLRAVNYVHGLTVTFSAESHRHAIFISASREHHLEGLVGVAVQDAIDQGVHGELHVKV